MQIWCDPAAPDPAASAVALNSTACKMSVRTSCEADPAARGFIAVNHPVIPSGDDAALSLSSVSPVSKTVFPKVSSEDLVGSALFFVSWPSFGSNPSSTSIFQNTTAAIHSAAVVAAAAPATPNAGTGPNPKIKIGSRTANKTR